MLEESLEVAINGRGAFRHFKDVLQEHPQERERWFAFQKQRAHRRILRWLETEDIVARQSYPESPPRVEYALTEKGRALLPVVHEMRRFGHDWLGCGVHGADL